ncbi:MAG: hypothetical protein IT440_01855 [Phycisphaeraceae bacterium]|nr:hypothetical protein [Phycisphaeraceae bacterium]
MGSQRMTLWQFFKRLKDPVPLDMVPQVMKVTWREVSDEVKSGRLKVLRFRAENGTLFRVVTQSSLRQWQRRRTADRDSVTKLRAALRKWLAA